MEAFIPRYSGCLLGCLDWVPNRGTCALMLACQSGDVTRSLRLHEKNRKNILLILASKILLLVMHNYTM